MIDLPPFPQAYAHIYPMEPHECHYEACFSPSTQPHERPHHFPIYTQAQLIAYAKAVVESIEKEMRLDAAMSVNGMWKDSNPQDGVEYQREIRGEWP